MSLNDQIKIDMVSADNLSENERKSILNREASIDAIPDLDALSGNVFNILCYLEKKETKELMKVNETAVKMYLNNKYADTVPIGIITLLMEENSREENVDRLLKMFGALKEAKKGKISLEDAEKNLSEEINQRYLYSKYGSKEEFERQVAREVQNERSNVENLRNTGKVRINN